MPVLEQAVVTISDDLGPEPAAASGAALDPERATEKQFYERFLARERADPGHLAAHADELLLAEGPEPEKVALLRALYDHDASGAAEVFLEAIRELPDVSRPTGESVPSFALVYLDRRAPRDAPARDALVRAAFESPGLAEGLRARAAASFFLNATDEELRSARRPLATEHDGLVRDAALEALSRNASSRTARDLLAAHGRSPSTTLDRPTEEPR